MHHFISIAKKFSELIRILATETNHAVNWFSENEIVVIPDRYQSIVVQKKQVLDHPTHFMIGNNKAHTECSVKLLGINIDKQLSFN